MEHVRPTPTNYGKAKISEIAAAFAQESDFLPGDRIEPLVARLGGTLHYLTHRDSIEAEDGSLVVRGPAQFAIYISAFTGVERNRFTIGHELGHYVLHSKCGQVLIQAARFGSTPVEWEANQFAAAFLMPSEDFRKAFEKCLRRTDMIAARYLVSQRAAEIRAESLGLSCV